MIEKLRYVLNCREDFDRIKHIISEKAEIDDVRRAAQFYQLISYNSASSRDSFGGKPHSMWSNFPLIEQASRQLQAESDHANYDLNERLNANRRSKVGNEY